MLEPSLSGRHTVLNKCCFNIGDLSLYCDLLIWRQWSAQGLSALVDAVTKLVQPHSYVRQRVNQLAQLEPSCFQLCVLIERVQGKISAEAGLFTAAEWSGDVKCIYGVD